MKLMNKGIYTKNLLTNGNNSDLCQRRIADLRAGFIEILQIDQKKSKKVLKLDEKFDIISLCAKSLKYNGLFVK